jgi:uncharacterized delta-60 repeat protein
MKSIITIILLVTISTINAQVKQEWVSRYNEPGNGQDNANSIAVDGSGNVYVTGRSRSAGAITHDDYATIKYNSLGVEQWASRYNGPANVNDWAYSIAVDGSGNVYVTGVSAGSIGYYATIKYNSSGVQQWASLYDGHTSSAERVYSIAVDNSGNVYVTGSYDVSVYNEDYATIKYNSSGVEQWVSKYNGPGNADDYTYAIALDGSGNVYVTGASDGSGSYNYDYATIKYNSSGVQQWASRYNGTGNFEDNAYSIVVDGSGNVYVTGRSWGGETNWDYTTIKYNSNGIEQWVQRYNGPGNSSDEAKSIAVDALGNVYVTGTSFGSGTGADYATIKYNASGVEQWVQRYNGPGNANDNAYSMAVDNSGNVYVTGGNYISITEGGDYATLKYNSSGVEQWVQRYNGPDNLGDWALSIALDGSDNVYVTGGSNGSETWTDYATVKYSQTTTGVYQTTSDLTYRYSLKQNYPNPFNPLTSIDFSIPIHIHISLKVFNVLGQEIAVLVEEELDAGTYTTKWDGTAMPGGIYFYRLQTRDYSETKKSILLR